MIMICELCKKDFLTEADPHVIRPTPKGYLHYCSCMVVGHDQISKIDKLKTENKKLREALEFYACHSIPDDNFVLKNSIATQKTARETLKEVGEE